jgi:fructose-1,6-bisphosphatase
LYQSKIHPHLFFLQTLCDMPQDHDHFVSDVFNDYTTLPLKNSHLYIVCDAPGDYS